MKKVFASFLSLVLALGVFCLPTKAAVDETALQDSYEKVKAYYESQDALYDPFEVMAVEALGLEAENYNVPEFYDESSNPTPSDLAKIIIANMLMKKDPRDVNGTDLVAMLEACVDDSGRIHYDGQPALEASAHVWCLFAFECVKSPLAEKAADGLCVQQYSDGGFSWTAEGSNAYAASDPDTTGWCINALVQMKKAKYQVTIDKAVDYLTNAQQADASWGDWGANSNTQACVLNGLIAIQKEEVLDGRYDKNGVSPLSVLFSFQNDQGSFGWNSTTHVSGSTAQSAMFLGELFNGSIVARAQSEYATWKDSNVLKSNPKDENPVVENKNNGPKTGDSHSAESLLLIMGICLCVMVRRGYAQN